MREYILTDQERTIIKTYLETGKKLKGFKVILSRARHMNTVTDDLAQIKWLLAKTEEEKAKNIRPAAHS